MRLTELSQIGQTKDHYMELRSGGCSREEATARTLQLFRTLPLEDRLAFWVGLADGQYARKELTLPVALQGLLALHRLTSIPCDITPGDIERRRKHYIQAPMPERKIGRPRKEAT